jgi:hypothetical protein
MMGHPEFDEEASIGEKGRIGEEGNKDGIVIVVETSAVPIEAFEEGNTLAAKLQRFAGKVKIEQRGIERVPENERTDTNGVVNVGTMVRCSKFTFFATNELMTLICPRRSGLQQTWWSARSQLVHWLHQCLTLASWTVY